MVASTRDAKGVLKVILSKIEGTNGSLGTRFRRVVATAMQLCPDDDDRACHMTPPLVPGGLAVWQLQRAQALMMDGLIQPLSIANVARECGLSYPHFYRAFKKSVGVPPRQWLCGLKVERAKWLLINTDQSLTEVASTCGFSDQSHFTRTFTRWVGMAPGVWRRAFSINSQLW